MNSSLKFKELYNKTPVILQDYDHDGVLVCLTMVLRYYGNYQSISVIRKQSQAGSFGDSIDRLCSMAENCDLSAQVRRIELDQLSQISLPAILHWGLNRFVVITKCTNKLAVIHDPASGKSTISIDELSRHFTGMAIELKPTSNFSKVKENEVFNYRELIGLLKGFRSSFNTNIVLAVFSQLFILAFPFSYRVVVDRVIENDDQNLLLVILSFFLILAVFHLFVGLQKAKEEVFLGANLIYQTTFNLVRHLFALPIKYFESRPPGDVVSRLSATRELEKVLSTRFIGTFVHAILSLIIIAIIIFHDASIGATYLFFIILYIVVSHFQFKRLAMYDREVAINATTESSNMSEALQSMQTIKLYAVEKETIAKWDEKHVSLLNSNIKKNTSVLQFRQNTDFLFNVNKLIVMYFSVALIMSNKLTIGEFFAIYIYGTMLISRIRDLVEVVVGYQMLFVRMNRVSDIILESPEDNKNRRVEVSSLQGNIKIENLSFSYPNEKKMLFNNLCFSIQQGEFVVLTGASGCGKTTLLKLMLGLYNADNGKICYDEHDISQCDLRSLRKQFGTVMQNDVIFSGTVASNIALFDPCPDPAQLRRVSRMAMIDDVIENFPLKYETIIGQNGGPLSGGQKQRLILARALYKTPKILFIDEGMAFLDVKTEIQVNKNLRSMNITRVTVAHRPESIRLADKIFNLDKQIFEDKDTYMVDLDMLKQ